MQITDSMRRFETDGECQHSVATESLNLCQVMYKNSF